MEQYNRYEFEGEVVEVPVFGTTISKERWRTTRTTANSPVIPRQAVLFF